MNSAFHTIVVSLLTGAFAISVLGIVLRVYVQNWKKEWIPTIGKYADFMAWVSALTGFVLIFAALITGFAVWPIHAVLNSSILKNKIFTAVLLLIFWAVFLVIRYKFRERIWQSATLSVYYFLLGVGAFFWGVVTNSIGGDVAGNSSGFEYIVHLIGVDTRWSFYLPTWMLFILVGLGVVAAFVPSFFRQDQKQAPKDFKAKEM
ncbi:hypothetical protein [Salipaludibacillus daqingensis]|uniref:hypothetical protein n=1 Tax=Salipaludibacillus daqingensis TaxID=3041001 RepID=UPI00247521B3|nr:hypothetical protein [Salipaludibacillus daqingensis]